jgi:hypothetical protein
VHTIINTLAQIAHTHTHALMSLHVHHTTAHTPHVIMHLSCSHTHTFSHITQQHIHIHIYTHIHTHIHTYTHTHAHTQRPLYITPQHNNHTTHNTARHTTHRNTHSHTHIRIYPPVMVESSSSIFIFSLSIIIGVTPVPSKLFGPLKELHPGVTDRTGCVAGISENPIVVVLEAETLLNLVHAGIKFCKLSNSSYLNTEHNFTNHTTSTTENSPALIG